MPGRDPPRVPGTRVAAVTWQWHRQTQGSTGDTGGTKVTPGRLGGGGGGLWGQEVTGGVTGWPPPGPAARASSPPLHPHRRPWARPRPPPPPTPPPPISPVLFSPSIIPLLFALFPEAGWGRVGLGWVRGGGSPTGKYGCSAVGGRGGGGEGEGGSILRSPPSPRCPRSIHSARLRRCPPLCRPRTPRQQLSEPAPAAGMETPGASPIPSASGAPQDPPRIPQEPPESSRTPPESLKTPEDP